MVSVDFETLAGWAGRMRHAGAMRRFAGLLRHRAAGYTANAMAVWVVPEAHVEKAGECAAAFEAVSHCYQRPSYPDWPYNLYTMIHGRRQTECEAAADQIAEALAQYGAGSPRLLYSTHEYTLEPARIRRTTRQAERPRKGWSTALGDDRTASGSAEQGRGRARPRRQRPRLLPAVLGSLAAVALVFGGYEVVERVWLTGSDSTLCHRRHSGMLVLI